MVVPDPMVYGFGSACLSILGWIGVSLAKMVKEVKLIGLIVRTCPNCQATATKIGQAQDQSEL